MIKYILIRIKFLQTQIKNFYKRDWSFSEKILASICVGLAGIIIGFILSPGSGELHVFSDFGTHNKAINRKEVSENDKKNEDDKDVPVNK